MKKLEVRITTLLSGLALAFAFTGCGDDASGDTDGDTATETEAGDDGFEISDEPAAAYTRVDRLGMPGVATALITSKVAYNAGAPADDADFAPEIVASVETLHAALDDDISGAGLTPCVVAQCVDTAAPFVIPDTLRVDATMPSGFPNGRKLADPVMDVVLALLLLDLTVHTPTTLAEVPINPSANDKPFGDAFPYLADPHV